MATRTSSALKASIAADASFRANVQFVEDTLVATGGWVVTADTGQTLPSAYVHPISGNTKCGYRIYRMNDSLQATAPVFMRLDFGSGNASITVFGIWMTIGMGSDGAGNITGKLYDGGASAQPQIGNTGSDPTAATNSYGSAAPGRASLGMFVNATGSLCLVFCIERTKNALGSDTNDGLLLVYSDSTFASGGVERSRYLIYAISAQPLVENGLSYILTSINPTQSFGGDIGAGVISHFKGVAQQPGINFLVVNIGDVGVEGSFTLTLYGSTHTYQQLNAIYPKKAVVGSASTINDTSARCCIRFD